MRIDQRNLRGFSRLFGVQLMAGNVKKWSKKVVPTGRPKTSINWMFLKDFFLFVKATGKYSAQRSIRKNALFAHI
ncbi:hypothetical protein Y032_0491g2401 [Ancylostoma ceylanicum]|uniref:Uncharacterized protein n=1 Tax=Ancylostoma ceylanicum TaxID=53326 RepID=A0A016WUP6_9BILA|nr:hypothetical protein Y032_0491g2401 [Ancylostoma ceylanicum]